MRRKFFTGRRAVLIFAALAAVLLMIPAWGIGEPAPQTLPLIVLDPGHGGTDSGVEGMAGSLEKNVVLRFARALEQTLTPDYRVKLTRSSDYRISQRKRASIANNEGAALFISIHAGGFFKSGPQAWGIYHYPVKEKNPASEKTAQDKAPWHKAQEKAAPDSKRLAESLSHYLDACPGIARLQTGEAPIFVLEGLVMPALVLETGYLTNPVCEEHLNDPDFLAEAAKCMRQGIDAFFRQQ